MNSDKITVLMMLAIHGPLSVALIDELSPHPDRPGPRGPSRRGLARKARRLAIARHLETLIAEGRVERKRVPRLNGSNSLYQVAPFTRTTPPPTL